MQIRLASFCEGFAEHAIQLLHQNSKCELLSELRKSWNSTYELGRRWVKQICSEGFWMEGFASVFLKTRNVNSPWHPLHHGCR
jgi:hypothetical protein